VSLTAKRRNQRSDAILINCTEGSYADMLKLVKTEHTLQGLKDGVQGMRRTANGSLLLKMQIPSDHVTQKLHTAIKSAEVECDIPAAAAPRMRKAYGGTQTVTVHLRPEHAQRTLDKGRIRVGWIACRIRQKMEAMLQMHGNRPHVCQIPSVRGKSQ